VRLLVVLSLMLLYGGGPFEHAQAALVCSKKLKMSRIACSAFL
jgi:heme A synthase